MKIKFINMPFANIAIPSIALTQLKAVTESVLGDKVKIDIHYLNHDFAGYLTVPNYNFISLSGSSNNSGFGDWFFAHAAHPHLPDNTKEYMVRYGPRIGLEYMQKNGALLQEKRQGLLPFLDSLIDRYELADADMVGFTSMFMQNVASLAMAKRIKRRNRDIIMVMGGANCETPMGEEIAKNFDVMDYIFSGTSLISFPKLVNCIMSGHRAEAECINGVFTKQNCRNSVHALAKVLVTEKGEVETVGPIGDELPINACVPLDYDSFLDSFEKRFEGENVKPYLLFETSRGCWWGAKAHCTFCGLNGGGMAYRAMRSEAAINMLNGLIERYQHRVKHFSCVDNIIPREYITEVFPYIKRDPDVTIFYEVRADLTSEEMGILAGAGVVEMQPGIEAIATSTLKLMKKGTSAFNNIRFLMNSVTHSVFPHWNLLIGFPGEEEATYEKYYNELPLLYHLPPPTGVFPVRFDRYSPYFMQTEKYKLDLHPLDYYSFIYPLDKASMHSMAYYFSDHNFEAEYIAITGKWLNRLEQRIRNWKKQWARANNTSFPKLFFQSMEGAGIVVDARLKDAVKQIPLQPGDKEILKNLDQRKNLEGLYAQMPERPSEELKTAVDRLMNGGLLFKESGTYMNLVFASEPFLHRSDIFH